MDNGTHHQEREFLQTRRLIELFTTGRINAAFLSLVVVVLLFAVIDTYLTLTFMVPPDRFHPFRFSPGAWIDSHPIRMLQFKYLGEVIMILLLAGLRFLFPRWLLIYQKALFIALTLLFASILVLECTVL